MKGYVCIPIAWILTLRLLAQLPDGSIAPDFNLIDIDGNQHHLYSYLSQGKTVILNFSESWCQECWNYHQSGALQDFYTLYGPGGTDEATVVFIETDPILGIDDLMGLTSASAGDWISDTPFGIIDDTAANNEFMPNDKPTIYGIYPDKTTTLLGRMTTDEIYSYVMAYDGPVNLVDTIIKVSLEEVKNVSCAGFSDGAIDISVDGPAQTYTYEWNNGATTQDIMGLPIGTYRVTIVDNLLNRHIIDPLALSEPDTLALMFLRNTPTSETANNGSVVANVSGGTTPYTYIWSTGDNTFQAENLGEGTYSVQVFDANGCQISDSIRLEVPDCSLVPAISVEPTSCDENPDGRIDLLLDGAVAPVTFAWSHGAATQNVGGLASGGYEVTITDGQGCTAIAGATVEIDDRENPIAKIRAPITLYLNEAGVVEIFAEQVDSGSFDNCGILDMQLEQSAYDCSDVGRNFIEFTVIDNNLNITSRDVEITILDTIQPYWECEDSIVVAACDGVVNYLAPRIVDNCPNGSVTVLAGLGPGAEFPVGTSTETYTYITNQGQRVECSIDVVVDKKVSARAEVVNVDCPGEQNGSATISVEDGEGPFTFQWSNGQNGASIQNLSAGSYRVTVSDTSGCTFVKTVNVLQPTELSVRLDSIKAPDGQGDVFITPMGGTVPYQYRWLRGNEIVSTVQDPRNLDFGVYSLMLTDGIGCQFDLFTVTVDLSTSIDESSNPLDGVLLSPNPAPYDFTITFPAGTKKADRSVEIYTMMGQSVWRQHLGIANSAQISPGSLSHGIYLVKIRAGQASVVRRLMVVR